MVKLKLSSFFMKRYHSQQCKAISRKLKRKQKQKRLRKVQDMDSNMYTNNQTRGGDTDINKLPDELLVHILSRMSLKEAARTSVIARRWKYLWRSVSGTLQFDFKDFVTVNGDLIEVEKFVSRVNTVLGLHQGRYIEGLVIIFEGMHEDQYDTRREIAHAIDSWVYSAVQKEAERFELRLSNHHAYKFPSIEMLRSHSYGICSPFRRARVLKLRDVCINDEVVHYLLASCPNLEELYLWYADRTKNLRIVDPPSLRVLELSTTYVQSIVESVEISAESIVSLALIGSGKTSLLLNRVPNLREFTIGNDYFLDFISQPDSSYSDQLMKLVVVIDTLVSRKPLASLPDSLPQFFSLKRLEVRAASFVGRSLLFFTSLIKASPQLCEFRIEMSYAAFWFLNKEKIPYPAIRAEEAAKFDHTSLKVVEMCGYVGFSSEDELLVELLKNCASSIERVVIDTESDYYDSPELATSISYRAAALSRSNQNIPELGAVTRSESKKRAQHFVSSTIFPYPFPFSHQIKFSVT